MSVIDIASKLGLSQGTVGSYVKTKRFSNKVAEHLSKIGFFVDSENTESLKTNTYLLDVTASAGLGSILENRNLENLPQVSLPNAPRGINIMIQVVGDSMYPTLGHMDYVAAVKVEQREDLREGHVYVIVDRDDGVLCKRLYNSEDARLRLVSDNKTYPAYDRSWADVVGVFKCWMRMSTEFRPHGLGVKEAIDRLDGKLDALIENRNNI